MKFKIQLVHALLIGKIRYNVATWGNLNLETKYKINQVIVNTVEYITQNIWYGRSTRWKMNEMGIPTFYRLYFNSCYIQTYKILNINRKNMMNCLLTKNRNQNLTSQNKFSTFLDNEMPSAITKISFEYLMREKYNKLPREITLSQTLNNFKKWLKKFNSNN